MAMMTDSRLVVRAKLFRGLSDVSRLALLEVLRTGEKTVTELVTHTGLSQSNVSGHLACLRECGLVDSRQEWRHVYYRLAGERIGDILGAAEAVLAANAERISACPSIEEGSEVCHESQAE
ncbi:MAG: winged helix-turn-helix transcriptional regulator [Chloroflexota bacterium]|nr:winged helix-turn-helix transcriptional regulator [Chloroflexota bacterium]